MSHTYTQLYVHFVWTTHARLPLITPEAEPNIHNIIASKTANFDCHLLAVGGMPDHMHVLVHFPPTLALSDLVKEMKGMSSHYMNHDGSTGDAFKWQSGYGAFTVSKRSVESVIDYVRNQKTRHANNQLIDELERISDE